MIKQTIDHKLTEEEIKEYLLHYKKKYDISYSFWCKETGVCRITISRIINGRDGKTVKLQDEKRTALSKAIEKVAKKFI